MAEELQTLKIQVKVNAETKQIEIVNSQIDGLGKTIDKVSDKTKKTAASKHGLTAAINELSRVTGINIPLVAGWGAAITSVTKLLSDSIKQHEEEIKRQRILKTTLEAVGVSYTQYNKRIDETLTSLSAMTRYTRDETFDVFNRALKITGNLDAAYKLLKISMDVSVGTGKSLNEVMSIFNTALASGQRGTVILAREFGKLGAEGKNAGEIINNLGKHFSGVAENEKSLEKETKSLKETYNDFTQFLGKELAPILNFVLKVLMWPMVGLFTSLRIAIYGVKQAIETMFMPMQVLFSFMDGGIKSAKIAWNDYKKTISKNNTEMMSQLYDAHDKLFNKIRKDTIEIKDVEIKSIRERSEAQEKLVNKTKEQADTVKEIKNAYEDLANTFSSVLASELDKSFKSMIESGQITEESLKVTFTNIYQAFRDMLIKMVAEMLAKAVIFTVLNAVTGGTFSAGSSIFGNFGKLFGGFQVGGEVPRTGAYVLHKGEKVIPPGSDSSITNNKSVVNVNLDVNAFDLRTLDKIQIQRIANQITPYIKKYMQ